MWTYNQTENLLGDSLYHSADELYHYGVLGMRWGHRKNINSFNKDKKQSKKYNKKVILAISAIGGISLGSYAFIKLRKNGKNTTIKSIKKMINHKRNVSQMRKEAIKSLGFEPKWMKNVK